MERSTLHCIFSFASYPLHLNLLCPEQQQGHSAGHFHSILEISVAVLVMVPEYSGAQAQDNSVQLIPRAKAIWKK